MKGIQARPRSDSRATETFRRPDGIFRPLDPWTLWYRAGGLALVVAPLLVLLGFVLRLPNFFSRLPPAQLTALRAEATYFPLQLAAFEAHPTLLLASYGSALAGNLLLAPAVLALAALIGVTRPGWAFVGGFTVLLGLFKRVYHAGVDHQAFQLVLTHGVSEATRGVGDSYGAISYGPFHIIGVLGFAVLFDWILLAIGAYLSGTLDAPRSIALGLAAFIHQGVLKGGTPVAVLLSVSLVIALSTLGIQLLRGSRDPRDRPPSSDPEPHAER